MAEDRLEKALEAIKRESVSADDLARAHDRVWKRIAGPDSSLCAEFRDDFRVYLDGKLAASRKLLVEDHLAHCTSCRVRLAEDKGERNVVPMPSRRPAWWPRWGTWAAAAAAILFAVYIGRGNLDRMLAPGGPRATVVSLAGDLNLVPQGILKPGSAVGENEVIRTGPGARAVLRLRDGSLVDVNERTELSMHSGWSGQSIILQRGDVIVRAAKQRRGSLRVETRDSVASVRGTIFAVSTGFTGSVVSVVEGSVAVTQPGTEVVLSPGQQSASNPALTSSVQDAVSWSPDAETYLSVLASVARIEKQLAVLTSPLLRTQSSLIEHMPANMVVYGAVPNLSGTIEQALGLAEQQTAENPAFSSWWNGGPGTELKRLIARVQTVTPLLGDEIVYGACIVPSQPVRTIPVLMAEVRPGKRAELNAAMENLGGGMTARPAYIVGDTLMAASNSAENLDWLLDHVGGSAGTPFAAEIAVRYQDGAAWLLGIDMNAVLSLTGSSGNEFVSAQHVKHIFVEQRSSQGIEENELAVSFEGQPAGIASILAGSGSGGAAEYLTGDSVFAIYGSTREPQQLFDELTAQFSRLSPNLQSDLAMAESRLGLSLSKDLARAVGTESAMSIEGFSTTGPIWTMALLVNDSAVIDSAIRKLVDAVNTHMSAEGKPERLSLQQETIGGREWKTVAFPAPIPAITWTYDRGYMVAGSGRGVASRAIATRNGGSPLVWSPAFKRQLSPSAGLHPSGFAWLNTKGAFEGLAALVPNPAIRKLTAERDPILVVFSGTTEQIRAVSRTRLSGMVVNFLLLQGMGRAGALPQTVELGRY